MIADVLDGIATGLWHAALMAYEVWWALVLGFAISAIVQAWVPRASIERSLGSGGFGAVVRATGWGAASSSCSYAAIAIAKTLFAKGASAATALAFQFASTNLVWELALVLWLLLGWQFAVAEFVGGVVLIVLMWLLLRVFVPARVERQAREHARQAATGHEHHAAATASTWRERLTSRDAWSDVAHNFRGDWQMLWKEIAIGFLLAGYVSLVPAHIIDDVFLSSASGWQRDLENVLVGPVIAIVTFVCSIGNVPLAAVLWSGGIGFAGVLSFIFADLLVLPILAVYRKYYGTAFAVRIALLMFVVMAIAALVVSALFSAAGLVPTARPRAAELFASPGFDYRLVLDVLATVGFGWLMWLTVRRGATDPVCGMHVDRRTPHRLEHDGSTVYFCSAHCMHTFAADHGPGAAPANPHAHAGHCH